MLSLSFPVLSKVQRPALISGFNQRPRCTVIQRSRNAVDIIIDMPPVVGEKQRVVPELSAYTSEMYRHSGRWMAQTLFGSVLCIPLAVFNPALTCLTGLGISIWSAASIDKKINTREYNYFDQGGKKFWIPKDEKDLDNATTCLIAGQSLAISPLIAACMSVSPLVIPVAVGLTGVIFGGCSWFAKRARPEVIDFLTLPVRVGLWSLVGMTMTGLAATLIFGPNPLTTTLFNVNLYGGLGFFTVVTMYDLYKAKEMYEKGLVDPKLAALLVYLDTLNIFVRLASIIEKGSKK